MSVGGDPGAANSFTGDTESVVQAGEIHGDVHVHTAQRSNTPPRQLPGGVWGFVDRDHELAQMDSFLRGFLGVSEEGGAGAAVAVVAGSPGVGKTALALSWAHRVRDQFPDGDLYLDMRGYGTQRPLSAEQGLDAFLRALHVPPEDVPVSVDEKASLYRSVLGRKRVLVVLDNVISVKQVRHLVPGSRRSVVLATSRSRLSGFVAREGAFRVTLDVLSPRDSVRLLAEVVGDDRVDVDGTAALRVAELCGHLPLALRVVAERAAARPHLTMRELVGELSGEQRRLDALASEEDELVDVRAVFSWSYRKLTSEQQNTFRVLGLHPGQEFCGSAAAALVGTSVAGVRSQLRELTTVHLLQETGPDRYKLHDLLRAYAIERAQQETAPRDRTHAIRRVLGWYLIAADAARRVVLPHSREIPLVPVRLEHTPSFGDVGSAVDWYETERLNLLAAVQQALDLGQFDIAWKIPVVADGFFELRSYWTEWRLVHEDGLFAARTVGDVSGEAANLLGLGDANWRTGELREALTAYELAAAAAGAMGDPWLEGYALRGTGLVHEDLRDLDRAADFYRRALGVFEASGIGRGRGMSLLSLGTVYRGLGEVRRAIESCETAVTIFRDIGDPWSVAWGLLPLALALVDDGRAEEAEGHVRETVDIFRRFRDRHSEALALDSLGDLVALRGDRAAAREIWTEARQVFDDLRSPRAEALEVKIGDFSDDG